MSQQTYEIITILSGIIRTLVQLGVLFGIWKVVFLGKSGKKLYGLFGLLIIVNVAAEFLTEHAWYRYILSAILIMGYIVLENRRMWTKGIFSMLLLYNFHASAFLMADCIYQYGMDYMQSRQEINSPDFMSEMYRQAVVGQAGLILFYMAFMLLFYLIFRKVGKNLPVMGKTELFFLSVLNIVGIIFTYMVVDLLVVKLENEVFMLFENRKEMLWKIPLMVSLLMAGEFSIIAIWKNYRNLLMEWQKSHIREEQLKQMKKRFEEVDTFYGDIRKVRHEMRNHMTNIKGLIATEKYNEVDSYIEKLDDTIQGLDFKYSTGNPLCDVIINDKAGAAERLHIAFDIHFFYQETNAISTFDLGIVLSNLLDNAIEACRKVSEESRFIRLKLKTKEPFILLEIENSYDGELVWNEEKKLPVSTKENAKTQEVLSEHGLGLKNVAEIADQYLGGMQIEADNHIFRTVVMLQKR
jgi:hypothetical protein